MHTLQQVLKQKENDDIWSVTPTNTVFEAIQVMADKRARSLLVINGSKLEGIISERLIKRAGFTIDLGLILRRDYAREVSLKGCMSKKALVGEIMSSNVITVAPTDSVQNALKAMTEHDIRHLPVVDNTTVVGVVSIGDLVKDVISVQLANKTPSQSPYEENLFRAQTLVRNEPAKAARIIQTWLANE